jgi:hypothetical protein
MFCVFDLWLHLLLLYVTKAAEAMLLQLSVLLPRCWCSLACTTCLHPLLTISHHSIIETVCPFECAALASNQKERGANNRPEDVQGIGWTWVANDKGHRSEASSNCPWSFCVLPSQKFGKRKGSVQIGHTYSYLVVARSRGM